MGIGVEGGGSAGIGAVVSSGPSLNIGPLSLPSFVREGPVSSFGTSLASLGPKLEGPTQSFVNEGPVKGGLDMFKPIGQINFKNQPTGTEVPNIFQVGLSDVNLDPSIKSVPQPENLPLLHNYSEPTSEAIDQSTNQVEPVAVSDTGKLAAVRETINSFVVPQVQPDFMTLFIPAPALESVVKLKSVLTTQVATQPQTETAVSQSAPISIGSAIEEQQIEELVEEEVEQANEDTQIQSDGNEDIKELKIQRVVDEPVIRQRIEEIISAAIEVQKQEKQEGIIEGQKIVEKLPSQHGKNRSGELNIVDPEGELLDGSLLATIKRIASVKFTSVIEVVKKAPKIVSEDIPVTRGKGRLVTDEDVAKVYDHKGRIPPAQQVIKRVVRMFKQIKIVKKGEQPVQIIPVEEKVEEKNEGELHPELAAALQGPQTLDL